MPLATSTFTYEDLVARK